MKVLSASLFAFLIAVALVGAPAFAAPASAQKPLVLAEWGDNYGGTPKGSGGGGGYGGGQSGGGGGWQQKPKQDDSDYTPSQKPSEYDDGGYKPSQKPSGTDKGNYEPKQKGGYGGGGQQGGPANNDDECIGHAGTQFPEHCRGEQDGGGNQQQGNSGDMAACRTQCDKKCKDDFVPGSGKQKSCSLRCARSCRG